MTRTKAAAVPDRHKRPPQKLNLSQPQPGSSDLRLVLGTPLDGHTFRRARYPALHCLRYGNCILEPNNVSCAARDYDFFHRFVASCWVLRRIATKLDCPGSNALMQSETSL